MSERRLILDERGQLKGSSSVTELLLAGVEKSLASVSPAAGRGGRRNVLVDDAVRELTRDPVLRSFLAELGMPNAFATRALVFNKTPTANWKVIWHQELTIAVEERVDHPGFGPWSVKAGVVHAHAPVDLLAGMINVRLHLDDSREDNGPLRVIHGQSPAREAERGGDRRHRQVDSHHLHGQAGRAARLPSAAASRVERRGAAVTEESAAAGVRRRGVDRAAAVAVAGLDFLARKRRALPRA